MSISTRSFAIAFVFAVAAILAPLGTGASREGTTRIQWSSGFNSRSFEARGAVEFTDDDGDVRAISPGSYIIIEEGNWLRTERSYEVRADSSGSLSRTYRVWGRARTMDAGAKAWAAGSLLTMIRESGLSAGLRVERILRTGGPAAVLGKRRRSIATGPGEFISGSWSSAGVSVTNSCAT
jgi:hypothetical protein